jgi:hypothetical protein
MILAHDARPLVAHVVFRFDVGGLENGVVNLINHMPADAYRHAVISLTEITDFRRRIVRDDVSFVALEKPPGTRDLDLSPPVQPFRQLRPAIVHSRNLAALEVAMFRPGRRVFRCASTANMAVMSAISMVPAESINGCGVFIAHS